MQDLRFIILFMQFPEWSVDNRKILWQQEETRENTLPEFDGVPYILNGTKVLECQYGVNRSAYQKKNHIERKKVKNYICCLVTRIILVF